MKQFAVAILMSASFGIAAVSDARPQNQSFDAQSSWQIYSPPDQSFKVEVPVTPHSEADDYEGLDDSTPGGWKPTHSYMAVASILQPRFYSISVFELTPAARETVDNAIDELIQKLAGKNYRLTSSNPITVAGARGRDFILARERTEENRFTRGRFIEIGAQVYLLMYVTDTADDVYSHPATRFFNSFQVKR